MMQTILFIIVGAAVLVGLIFLFRTAVRSYVRYRGTRIVTCPETRQPVAVEADALHVAAGAIRGIHHVRLRDCTRWPEREGCGQECLAELEASPEECLLRNILQDWYRGKECAFCGKTFGDIHWHDHKPALMDAEGQLRDWSDVPPDKLAGLLESHLPVCWDCLIAERFRKEHPDLVVDR